MMKIKGQEEGKVTEVLSMKELETIQIVVNVLLCETDMIAVYNGLWVCVFQFCVTTAYGN